MSRFTAIAQPEDAVDDPRAAVRTSPAVVSAALFLWVNRAPLKIGKNTGEFCVSLNGLEEALLQPQSSELLDLVVSRLLLPQVPRPPRRRPVPPCPCSRTAASSRVSSTPEHNQQRS